MRNLIFKDVEDYYDQLNKNMASTLDEKKEYFKYYSLDEFIGDGGIERIAIGNGIEISITKVKFNDDFEFAYKVDKNVFEIIYCTKGKVICSDLLSNDEIIMRPGDIQFWKNEGSERKIKYPQNIYWETICIYFDNVFLERLPKEFNTFNEAMLLQEDGMIISITLSELKIAFNDMLNFKGKSNSISRLLYLQSKAIEIVALFIEKELFKKDKSIKKLNLKEEDIGKIKLAKTLIVKDIINPPSIEELSDLVGLNTFKLKVGFKQLYKTTIFGCLRNARMERAKEYLKEGRLTVIEIANNVGYSNPSHFAVAFRKKYGINPSKLQNRA
jgi:AraC-like DNA-binding protein